MKNLFKFTAAAVALFAFASCSDDIAEFGGGNPEFTAANELKIEAEEMDGGNLATRSAYVATNNARVWQETDEFKVFGPKVVGMYDYYKFSKSSNKFVIDGNKDVEEAAWVGFPNDWLSGQDWKKETQSAYLQYDIPEIMDQYDEVAGSDPIAYVSNLPLWGTAENDGEGIKAKVYFLTAIVKVSLENADGNAKAVRIAAYKNIAGDVATPIAGTSKVQVSKDGTAYAATDVQLPAPATGANMVVMPLGDLSKKASNSVIYLPLIAGTYGNVKVQYTNATPAVGKTYVNDNTIVWSDIQVYKNKEFKRGTCYGKGNTHSFNAAVENVAGLNTLLAGMTSASGEVEVKCANDIAVGAAAAVGNNIVIPDMPSVTSLTLDFDATKQFTASAAGGLTISGDFAGTFILNATSVANVNALTIELPNANVVIAQPIAGCVFNMNYAKDVQFGGVIKGADGSYTAQDFNPAGAALTFKADVADVTIFKGATVGNFNIPADHLTEKVDIQGIAGNVGVAYSELAASMAVTVSGKAGNITISDKDASHVNNGTVEVSGCAGAITTTAGNVKLTGTANTISTGAGAVEISGKVNYSDLSAEPSAANAVKVNTVTTSGNVTVNLDNEGAAIGTKLIFNDAATLTLTQGYVKEIDIQAVAATKKVTCTIADEKYATLTKITTAASKGTFELSNTPKWNGQKIGGSILTADQKKAITDAKLATSAELAAINWSGYKEAATAVYTGIGLAENAGTFTLANDINLNNKAWAPTATTGAIAGMGHTISNLTLAVQEDKCTDAADAGRGLFTSLGHNVGNLTLDGVTIAAVPYKVNTATTTTAVSNVGALAGKATEGIVVSNVTVKNAALSTTGGGCNVGGLFGTVTRSATDDDVLALNGVIVSGTIKGYHSLGGFIGSTVANVTIAQIDKDAALYGDVTAKAAIVSSATATFASNYDSESTNDLNYLKVGNFIGTIGLSGAETTISAKIAMTDIANVKPTLTYTKTYTGTTKYAKVEGDVVKYYDIISDKQTLIGYCGDKAFAAGSVAKINKNSSSVALTYPILLNKAALGGLTADQPNYLYYFDM